MDVEKLRKKGRVKKFGIESAAVPTSSSKPFIAKSQPQHTFLSWFCQFARSDFVNITPFRKSLHEAPRQNHKFINIAVEAA